MTHNLNTPVRVGLWYETDCGSKVLITHLCPLSNWFKDNPIFDWFRWDIGGYCFDPRGYRCPENNLVKCLGTNPFSELETIKNAESDFLHALKMTFPPHPVMTSEGKALPDNLAICTDCKGHGGYRFQMSDGSIDDSTCVKCNGQGHIEIEVPTKGTVPIGSAGVEQNVEDQTQKPIMPTLKQLLFMSVLNGLTSKTGLDSFLIEDALKITEKAIGPLKNMGGE